MRIIQRDLKSRYGFHHILNQPVHVTLQKPFRLRADQLDHFLATLKRLSTKQPPVVLETGGYGHFNRHVIFIQVERTSSLIGFQDQLKSELIQKLNFTDNMIEHRLYKPHITLASKVLKPPVFEEVWNFIQHLNIDIEYRSTQRSYWLLKHNGKIWEPFKELKLNPNTLYYE